MLTKIIRHLRRRFIDAPRGFGHPVPAAAFDEEFRSGHWCLLDSTDEQTRYTTLVALVRTHKSKPKLLDAGCGSGRLARCFEPGELTSYHGIDLSGEAIRHARDSTPSSSVFQQGDLENWQPDVRYDVIVVNEVMGYFHDPAATITRLAEALEPGGFFVISLYRWGNAAAIWQRLDSRFKTMQAEVVANANGDKKWDIRIMIPIEAAKNSRR